MRTIIINKNKVMLAAIALLTTAPLTAVAAAYDYAITVDDDLETMTVEARFDRPVTRISARSSSARSFLKSATRCDNGERLRTRSRSLRIPTGGIRCLRYTVDLAAAGKRERVAPILHDDNIVVSPTVWLWRPPLRGSDTLTARFHLARNHSVFVPWKRVDDSTNTFELSSSPQSGSATAVFGRFDTAVESIGSAELNIALLGTRDAIEFEPLTDWVRDTAGDIVRTYGRFPNPSANVVLIPVGGYSRRDDPIPFGRVVRDGGETIELLINQNRPVDDYYTEWTPTHEFSHLMVPYLERRHRWISEGFAQYYQNVLLARAGKYSERRAWGEIVAGLERGASSSPSLSPNDAAMNRGGGSRMKFYWSGAAIALLADVELRRTTNGRQSLDSALGQLQACCLPAARKWTGPELFSRLDELTDTTVFMDLYHRHATTAGFPPTRAILDELGVVNRRGRVSLNDNAALADIRVAILRESAEAR